MKKAKIEDKTRILYKTIFSFGPSKNPSKDQNREKEYCIMGFKQGVQN